MWIVGRIGWRRRFEHGSDGCAIGRAGGGRQKDEARAAAEKKAQEEAAAKAAAEAPPERKKAGRATVEPGGYANAIIGARRHALNEAESWAWKQAVQHFRASEGPKAQRSRRIHEEDC